MKDADPFGSKKHVTDDVSAAAQGLMGMRWARHWEFCWLALGEDAERIEKIRRSTMTGRPCGNEAFVDRLKEATGRLLRPKEPGRPKAKDDDAEMQAELF